MPCNDCRMNSIGWRASVARLRCMIRCTMLMTKDNSSTVGAPSPDALTGAVVRLWPYAPGVYGRDALYRVWKLMEDDGATKRAFWDDAHVQTGGDLVSFVTMFNGPQRLLL